MDHSLSSSSEQAISTNGWKADRIWHPEVPLLESVKNQLMLDWNRSGEEQCGFIDTEWEIHYVPNVHEVPRSNYLMEELETKNVLNWIYNVREEGVIGIFHTHPNNAPWPSARDIVGWPDLRLGWRYFIVLDHDVVEWRLVHGSP
jgi:proteasome lid subunit RPN8/RPN11